MASACFIAEGFTVDNIPESLALLVCADPEISFIKAVGLLHPARLIVHKLHLRQCLKIM